MSNERNDGGAAFPCEQGHTPEGNWNHSFDPGMTLRDYFAAKAMQAFATGAQGMGDLDPAEVRRQFDIAADFSYRMADAMLKVRQA